MGVQTRATDSLLERLAAGRSDLIRDRARVGRQLEEILAAARQRWPAIAIGDEQLVAHLARKLEGAAELDAALAELHTADLFLACACAEGDVAAIAEFERSFMSQVALAVCTIDRSADFVDEVRQRMREKVLVGPAARIRNYSGKGPLGAWVRVAATRAALDLQTQARRRARSESASGEPAASATGPDQQLLRGRYRPAVEAALRLAFDRLDAEQRHLLRLHYVDGISLQQIGRSLGVDRSTASRRVSTARDLLLVEMKRQLHELLGLSPSSLDTLLRSLHSQLELSLSLLRP